MKGRILKKAPAFQFERVGSSYGITCYRCGRTVFFTSMSLTAETLSVESSWAMENSGYLFLGEDLSPAEEVVLPASVAQLAACCGHIMLGWIENPSRPFSQWNYQLMLCEQQDESGKVLLSGREFVWQRYALFLPGAGRLVLEGERIVLKAKGRTHHLITPDITLEGYGELSVSLTGAAAGIWEADFVVPGHRDIFERMDAGIRYYAEKDGQPYRATAVLLQPEQEILLHGFFNLAAEPESGIRLLFDEGRPLRFACDIPTIYGRGTQVEAVFSEDTQAGGDWPGLVFARGIRWFAQGEKTPCVSAEYYLTYTGNFQITLDFPEDDRILCGVMGTEYIRSDADSCLPVKFCPGNHSYCCMDSDGAALHGLSTTAWLSFGASDRSGQVLYYSAAPGASLYAEGDGSTGLLDYLELPTANLRGQLPVPVFPVRRLLEKDQDSKLLRRMELECILPMRSAVILNSANGWQGQGSGEVLAVTPQGLLVGVADGRWNWVGIASNRGDQLPDSRLSGLSERLQMEFQNSRLFLPMAEKARISEEIAQWKLHFEIEGWEFIADQKHFRTDKEDQSNTAVILKFARDRSIDEMMGDSDFRYPQLAGNVKQIYSAAVKCSVDRDRNIMPDYKSFHEMIHNREFCGILILNCPLSMKNMPAELKLLLAGLQEDALYAHHVGVHANDIIVKDGIPVMKRSSYFGLVDYANIGVILNEGTVPIEYDFLTKRLLLEVRNSSIARFAAEAELMANRLFDAPASASAASGNCLILDGIYQQCAGVGQYVFSLRQNTVFHILGSMIESVEVTAVRMTAGQTQGRLAGSFGLTGRLRFDCDAACDIWAYGAESEASAHGVEAEVRADGYLAFCGISIEMQVTDDGSSAKKFHVSYGSMSLDGEQSVRRRNSLPNSLPAYPESLTRYDINQGDPSALGFRSITCPVTQGEIKSHWYGLLYRIPLGTLGQNSPAKGLELKLLCAWATEVDQQGRPPVFIGILLPGMAAGGIGLSLQGILKLDFKSVELLVFSESEKMDYQLCFRNFTLSALGLSFPQGKNNIYLFGEDGSRLGWYAAYQEDGDDGGKC